MPVETDVLRKEIIDVDGLYCHSEDNVDATTISFGRRRTVIATNSAGYDSIDLRAATERGTLRYLMGKFEFPLAPMVVAIVLGLMVGEVM